MASIRFTSLSALLCTTLTLWASAAPAVSPAADTPVSQITFVAFDTETTGFGATRNRVIELAAVKWSDGRQIEEHQWLVDPEMAVDPHAERVHHITPEMLEGQPRIAEVLPQFRKVSEGCVLLAHNASFDVRFLDAELKRSEQEPMGLLVIDTLALFRAWFPEAPDHSIAGLVTYLKIPQNEFHRALQDSQYIVAILQKALEQLDDPDLTLGDMLQAAGSKQEL